MTKYLFIILGIIIVACSPSAGSIQTAMVETENSNILTAVGSSPEISFNSTITTFDLKEIDLPRLISSIGYLPYGLTLAESTRSLPGTLDEAPPAVNLIDARFINDGQFQGGITIFIYDSLELANYAYLWAEKGYGALKLKETEVYEVTIHVGPLDDPEIGEDSSASYSYSTINGLIVDQVIFVVFQRCNAVVVIVMAHRDLENEEAFIIARYLDIQLEKKFGHKSGGVDYFPSPTHPSTLPAIPPPHPPRHAIRRVPTLKTQGIFVFTSLFNI